MQKKQNQIIGYTTGVFDLFHIGHLNILRRAKNHCDILVVGVTTDELVKIRKNKTPIIPLVERIEIIKAIKYVDRVIIQEHMDKFRIWEDIRFHTIFVGDDWKGTEKWTAYEKEFAKVGVKIVYFPYTKTTSSSLLRQVLHKFNSA